MNAPTTVRIFGRDYDINYHSGTPLGPAAVGLCNNMAQVIDIDLDVSEVELADSVLHETCHGILYTMKVGLDEATEEKVVSALATGLIGVLQDNPEYAQWLIRKRPQHGRA